jgi:hypothetical protein
MAKNTDDIFNGGAYLERYKDQVRKQMGVNLNRNKNGDLTDFYYPSAQKWKDRKTGDESGNSDKGR